MDLPQHFGKYELLRRIATGGMAEIFLARSFGVAGFEKRLAIKRIRPEFAQDPHFVSLFINEAKIAVHLNHPNIVQVYELGRVGSTLYIAMEHLHGRDLTRLVKTLRAQEIRLPVPVAVRVAAEVCRGLFFAHTRTDASGDGLGLVHQDVSPHNVLITFTGEVKLVDFGIARLMNTAAGADNGQAPGGGKYAYMSPEQARGESLDHRSDIFSTGILLWELLAGRRLYQDPDPAAKLALVKAAEVSHPSTWGSAIDPQLWAILQRSLARDRDARYASAALFEEDLRAWLFETRTRVGRDDLASVMRDAFPDAAAASPEDLDLRRMVADLYRLDPDDATLATVTTPADASATHFPESVGERKRVAAVMVDVDGLTQLSARVEPEALFTRRYQLLRWLRRVVDPYGGVVQRAVDDHVLLLFGVPHTQVDDLERALECAQELVAHVRDLASLGLDLHLAIGVHTGEVTVGPGRTRVRYVARGDTTRFARRLSAAADHQQVLVSDAVLTATEGAFLFRGGPAIPNRGGQKPYPSYALHRRRAGLRVRGDGAWIRRGDELDQIRSALVAVAKGQRTVMVLRGGVGTGKSRLIHEIRELAHSRGIPFYAGRAGVLGVEAAQEPARELVRDVLGVDPDAPLSGVLSSLPRLAQLGLPKRQIEVLRSLFVPGEGTLPSSVETCQALGRVFAGLATEGPVILTLGDLHALERCDRRALIDAALATQGSALFLLTLRGPLPHRLEGHCVDLQLGAFPPAGQRRLLHSLLHCDSLDEDLVALVARSCEGNPLYIQEMVTYLLQEQRIRVEDGHASLLDHTGQAEMPISLAALITARIDALGPASKGVLQLAAVTGETFSADILANAAGVDDITPLITDLASQGLVHASNSRGHWSFVSELVREAASRGILGIQRRDYHRLIAEAIEALYPKQLEGWAGVLAEHCHAGGRPVDAARYAYQAGQAHQRRHRLEAARTAYQSGLRSVVDAEPSPDTWDARTQGEALLRYQLGSVCLLLGDQPRGEHQLQLALDIAADAMLPWVEVRAHLELGRSYTQRGRLRLASAHLGQARALLRLQQDDELELEALEASAVLAHEEGRNEDAEAIWQRALTLAGSNAHARARCQLGLANRFLRMGLYDKAAPLLDAALKAARQAPDRILEGRILNNIGLLNAWMGHQDEALVHYRRALRVREGIGYSRGVVVNHHNIGDLHFQQGDWARAWVSLSRSRELALEMGWRRGVLLNDTYLGYISARETGELSPLRTAIAQARTLDDYELAVTGQWLCGRWLQESGRHDQASEVLRSALTEAEQRGLGAMAAEIEEALATTSDRPG